MNWLIVYVTFLECRQQIARCVTEAEFYENPTSCADTPCPSGYRCILRETYCSSTPCKLAKSCAQQKGLIIEYLHVIANSVHNKPVYHKLIKNCFQIFSNKNCVLKIVDVDCTTIKGPFFIINKLIVNISQWLIGFWKELFSERP